MEASRRLIALDATAAILTVATFARAAEPDLLFHAVWVVLVFQAFLYGLRVSAPRILLAALAVIAYSLIDGSGGFMPAELSGVLFTEWPLMFVIIAIVAVMADRVTRTGRHLADLERRTHEQLLTARADERRLLSSELHDGLGQTLTALVLTLDAAESSLK